MSNANFRTAEQLESEAKEKSRPKGVVPISRNGRTVAFLVSRDKLAALMETMELQKDAGLMELIRKDKAGKVRFTAVPDEM